ncbi:MAG: hypothetical protein K5865_07475 [Eubacterium sp.]|nr:hypothetical protein [Eubacterium sp.]
MIADLICGSNFKIMMVFLIIMFLLEAVSSIISTYKTIPTVILSFIAGVAGFIYMTIKTVKPEEMKGILTVIGIIEVLAFCAAIISVLIKGKPDGILFVVSSYAHTVIVGSVSLVIYHYWQNLPLIFALTFIGLLFTWAISLPSDHSIKESEDEFGDGAVVFINNGIYTYTKNGDYYYVTQGNDVIRYNKTLFGFYENDRNELYTKTFNGFYRI